MALLAALHAYQKVETVDFSLTEDQQNIREAVLKHCSQFSDEYWLELDRSGEFPVEFHRSMAQAGWLGVAHVAEGAALRGRHRVPDPEIYRAAAIRFSGTR